VLAVAVPEASAVDHSNLDQGRPVRVEDPYPIAAGEWALETGVGFTVERENPNRGFVPIELLYGPALNLQVGIATRFSTNPGVSDEAKSGDLELSALYNFNRETITTPAFGLRVGVLLPTGVDSAGTDLEVKGLLTRSFNRLRVHFNSSYTFLGGTPRGGRDGRYQAVLGVSHPVGGLPKYTYTTLVGDVFTEQALGNGEANVVGAEIGVRHQWTTRVVLDTGISTEFAGPDDRSSFSVATGFSAAF
jgi:hypothetical protein